MKKDTQKAVALHLWEAINLLIPAYCDAVSPTKKEIRAQLPDLCSDEDITLFEDLQLARSCERLREHNTEKKAKSAKAGSGK